MNIVFRGEMFNIVVNNYVIEESKSGTELRKAAQLFNELEAYVEDIIGKITSSRPRAIKMKKFVHDEVLRKLREVLKKEFQKQRYTMDISMWRLFLEGHAGIYLRQYCEREREECCLMD